MSTEVTDLLKAIESGDPDTSAPLLPPVYDDLRRLAAQRLPKEGPGQTLDPTGLVHEVLPAPGRRRPGGPLGQPRPFLRWRSRGHAPHPGGEKARHKRRLKCGGGMVRQDLEMAELLASEPREDILALDDALTKLVRASSRRQRLIGLAKESQHGQP